MGQGREHVAIERIMFVHCSQLLDLLGFPFGWWCGVELPRADLFGDDDDGDVDLVAGPLEFSFDSNEWTRRLNAEAAGYPLTMPHGAIVTLTASKAVEEGHVVWPPSMDFIAGVEVKARKYTGGEWRPTYTGPKRNAVIGQLQALLERGMDVVTSFNICSTEPRTEPGTDTWLAAGAEARAALDAARPIFTPDELPGCGYAISVFGAVPQDSDGYAGAIISPRFLRTPIRNIRPDAERTWRARLRARLATMPKPRFIRSFILHCKRCGEWRHAPNATQEWNPCPCGAAALAEVVR
jgi:hypothetical protein